MTTTVYGGLGDFMEGQGYVGDYMVPYHELLALFFL